MARSAYQPRTNHYPSTRPYNPNAFSETMRRQRPQPRPAFPRSARDLRKASSWARVTKGLARVARFPVAGAAVLAATMLDLWFQGYWYPKQDPEFPPGFRPLPGGKFEYWNGVATNRNAAALPAELPCRWWSLREYPNCMSSFYRRFYEPADFCSAGSQKGAPVFTLPPGCLDIETVFPPGIGPPPAPFFPPPQPGPQNSPGRNPRVRRGRVRRPRHVPEIVIEITDKPSVAVRPNPQPRPPRGVKETKLSSKGQLASLVFWLWEVVDDVPDWIDIITESAGGDKNASIYDKIREMTDPKFWTEMDAALLARLGAEWWVEERVGAYIGDIEAKLASKFGQPINVGWSVNSGGNWGIDDAHGGSVVSEVFSWLDQVAAEYMPVTK